MLDSAAYENKLQYVLGSPLQRSDLARVAVSTAEAVFVFTSMRRDTSDEAAFAADAAALLVARAVRDASPRVPVLLQLLRRESVARNSWASADLVVCQQALRMSVLAMSCLHPGMSTFIANLVSSFGDKEQDKILASAGAKLRDGEAVDDETEAMVAEAGLGPDAGRWKRWGFGEKLAGLRITREQARRQGRAWRTEYCSGMRQEVYAVPLSPALASRPFPEVAALMNRLYGVTLFAVETQRQWHHPSWSRGRG